MGWIQGQHQQEELALTPLGPPTPGLGDQEQGGAPHLQGGSWGMEPQWALPGAQEDL